MGRHTVWQRIVGSTPTKLGLVIECLACGHPGKRTEPARAEQRIVDGRTRVCLACTAAQRRQADRVTCAHKWRYLSETSAQKAAAHFPGQQQVYRCPVCHQWHCASA